MALKILIDTNVFIAAEEIRPGQQHQDSAVVVGALEAAARGGHQVYVADGTTRDIHNDEDRARRDATLLQLKKYQRLQAIPVPPDLVLKANYSEPLNANDNVDLSMLVALHVNAVDVLITHDKGLKSHATKAGLGARVLTALDATEMLASLESSPISRPTLERVKAYEIQLDEPIFDTIRAEYGNQDPPFDVWMNKARNEHRDCLVVRSAASGPIEALAILKIEKDRPYDLPTKTLKICTFKVGEQSRGSRRGELLLQGVFDYAEAQGIEAAYVEAFPEHGDVIAHLESFGFEVATSSARGEIVLTKHFSPGGAASSLSALEFHIAHGPPAVRVESALVIPIQPQWHDALFPELARANELFPPRPYGNAITKAYLSKSRTHQVTPGSLLLFYRSEDAHSVGVIGVAESIVRSGNPEEISQAVGNRTVYDSATISNMCSEGIDGIVAVLFRRDRLITPTWSLDELRSAHVLNGTPQSITRVSSPEGLEWLRTKLEK